MTTILESTYIKIKTIVQSPIFTDFEKIGMLNAILRSANVISEMNNSSHEAIISLNELLTSVNRVEVIDKNGRAYHSQSGFSKVSIELQDNNQTLKIFIK